MVGLVIATHGHLAQEMVATAEQIVGTLPACTTVSIVPGAAPEEIKAQMREAIRHVDSGDGVILFADLFGGTPCTQSLSLCSQLALEVLTGVNLPMLLKANSLRGDDLPLDRLAAALTKYGQKNITCASALLRAHDDHSHKG